MDVDTAALSLRRFPVGEVVPSERPGTSYAEGVLRIDVDALRAQILSDELVGDVTVEIVAPNERARIINVVDVLEARIKPEMAQPDYYPGVGTAPFPVGTGQTNVLSGLKVVTAALVEPSEDALISCEPGQRFRSSYADGWIVVVNPTPAPGASAEGFAQAVVDMGCRVSVELARATVGLAPAATVEIGTSQPSTVGPRLAYLCYVYSHGFGREKLLYGMGTRGIAPTVIPVADLLDGAVVNTGYTRPVRNSTDECTNNRVALELALGHGTAHTMAGLVIMPHAADARYKEQYARMTARIVREVLQCDGVIITKDGGGQADVDVMNAIDACEAVGVRTVAATPEDPGDLGDQPPVVSSVEAADALVSLGTITGSVEFGPVDRVVGGPRFARSESDPHGQLRFPAGCVPGLIDFMAGSRVRCREH